VIGKMSFTDDDGSITVDGSTSLVVTEEKE